MKTAVLILTGTLALMPIGQPSAEARVVKIVVEKTRPFAEGKSFGSTGPSSGSTARCISKSIRATR